ncbi:hypothetical protein IHE45_07G098100 [Dioscorea alata]|uniref:Uncharacterized protein n=2 Tax=Dioscorea alata TaxID=55571 RepID=A0ACB7VTC1_DIOAL|nr:hypothetical protein IHE45_07G098100 [Dioscorea alata]KAH7677654.1 hypothetical protein IHE45_07G098100 [Dioscorea alata]
MDGKKKKGKKKKGNQNKSAEDSAPNAEEVGVQEQDDVTDQEQNHKRPQVSRSNIDAQSVVVSESDAEIERHKNYEAKFALLQDKVKRLEDEKNLWLEREIILEEKIKHLQNEVHSCMYNETSFQEKLNDLKNRNDSLMQKEAILEERVNHIEGTREAWSLKEASCRETIAKLDEVNTVLQAQVKELEESRDATTRENQMLTESISCLEIRIQHLEEISYVSSREKLMEIAEENTSQTQAAPEPVKNLETNNEHLDGKIKELHFVPDGYSAVAEPSIPEQDQSATTPVHYVTDYRGKMSESADSIQSAVRNHEMYNGVQEFGVIPRVLPEQVLELEESRASEEIVQIPLDDTPVRRAESQPVINYENTAVSLTDAPLVGAPFRLISFMAKFVSGADLVKKNNSERGQQ